MSARRADGRAGSVVPQFTTDRVVGLVKNDVRRPAEQKCLRSPARRGVVLAGTEPVGGGGDVAGDLFLGAAADADVDRRLAVGLAAAAAVVHNGAYGLPQLRVGQHFGVSNSFEVPARVSRGAHNIGRDRLSERQYKPASQTGPDPQVDEVRRNLVRGATYAVGRLRREVAADSK